MLHDTGVQLVSCGSRACRLLLALTLGGSLLFALPRAVSADEPGRGATAEFEVEFMKFLADHHLAALRETELCQQRVQTPQLLSLCRRNNAVQREEILTLQRLLHDWYEINYQPQITPEDQRTIDDLASRHGADFEIQFLQEFGRHHYAAVQGAVDCLVGADLKHKELERLCRNVVNSQLSDIDEMRHLLCDKYHICDFQAFDGKHE